MSAALSIPPYPVYLPGELVLDGEGKVAGRRAPEPAPAVLDEAMLARLLHLDARQVKGEDVKRTIERYRRSRDNPLPAVQVGRQILYPLDGVLAWLKKQQEVNPR